MSSYAADSKKFAAATQYSENDPAEIVFLNLPQPSTFLTCLNPEGNLLEEPMRPDELKRDHEGFQKILREKGCRVYLLYDIMAEAPPERRKILMEHAMRALKYELDTSTGAIITPKMRYYVSDEYKRTVLEALSTRNLVDVILSEPTINLLPDGRNTQLLAKSTEIRDCNNLTFMRDQQITTRKGVVMGQFQATQRRREQTFTKLVWDQVGVNVVGDCREGGPHCMIEGGDFMNASAGLAMLGVGLRSSYVGAHYLMEKDLLGTRRLAVVKDCFDQDQDRMHLDCTCCILHDKLVVLDEYICSGTGLRYVDEWLDIGADNAKNAAKASITHGNFVLVRANIEFQRWLTENGYSIVRIPHEYQLAYGCNSLNLGNNCVLCVHEPTIEFIKKDATYVKYCKEHGLPSGLDLVYVPFRGVTRMYGSLHCASQVVYRTPSSAEAVKKADAEGDGTATLQKANTSPVDADNKMFDCLLYIPTNAAELISELKIGLPENADPRKEISQAIYEIYKDLVSKGRVPYITWRVLSMPIVSLKGLGKDMTLKEALMAIPNQKPYKARYVKDAVAPYTRYLGLELADICVDLKAQ